MVFFFNEKFFFFAIETIHWPPFLFFRMESSFYLRLRPLVVTKWFSLQENKIKKAIWMCKEKKIVKKERNFLKIN